MKIRLGYVAISLTLNITSSKSITYTYYNKLNEKDKSQKLDTIIKQNLQNLKQILKYNHKNKIFFYRMSHKLIPLATHPQVNFDYITPYKKEYEEIGKLIKKYNIRLDAHPDQFCVLNSQNKIVVQNTIQSLNYIKNIFEAMQINSKIILHVGGAYDNKEKAIKTFKANFKKLDKNLQKMIILENDDKTYNAKEVLEICEELNIPMCLDYHHYKCNNEGEKIEKYLQRIINTWKNETPKMHFSSPKNKKEFRSHSDYINEDDFIHFLNILKPYNTNIDIMLECKAKDEALFRLIRQIKYKTNLKITNQTIINL